jgi:hypothetical protein
MQKYHGQSVIITISVNVSDGIFSTTVFFLPISTTASNRMKYQSLLIIE